MALQGNPFENRLSGKGPEIEKKPKTFAPLNPWDDPVDTTKTKNEEKKSEKQTSEFKTTNNQTSENRTSNATRAVPKGNDPYNKTPEVTHTSENQTSQNQTTNNQTSENNTTVETEYDDLGLKYGGWMPLKCSIFSPEMFLELEPGEFKVLCYLTFLSFRYPQKRGHIRAALPYLARGTGISRSTIHGHLKALSDLGFIRCVEVNKKIGNVYYIDDSLLSKKSEKQTSEFKTSEFNMSEVQNSDVGRLKNTLQKSEKQTKDLHSYTLSLNSLTLNKLLNPTHLSELETRWLSFLKKEREREERGLLKLMGEKPDEAHVIFKAFQIIIKEQDEYGEIKSVIAVLETNYSGQYREKALAALKRQEQREKESQASVQAQEQKKQEEDGEAEMQLVRNQCFAAAFPDIQDRKAYILETCKANPTFMKFGADSPIAIGFAVSHWAQNEGSQAVLEALDQRTN